MNYLYLYIVTVAVFGIVYHAFVHKVTKGYFREQMGRGVYVFAMIILSIVWPLTVLGILCTHAWSLMRVVFEKARSADE